MIRFQPTKVATSSRDTAGMLIFSDDLLVAVMVQLEDEVHGVEYIGKWNLEATFDGLPFPASEPFENLDAAKIWITEHLHDGS